MRIILFVAVGMAALTTAVGAQERCDTHAEHWTYEKDKGTGPSCWGQIESPNNKLCAEGRTQSPVNFKTGELTSLVSSKRQVWRYPFVPLTIWNNGHAIVLKIPDEGPKAWNWEVNGVRYALKQMHFHAPGEHEINGKAAPLEMHMVHESIAPGPKRLAVRATLFKVDRTNSTLSTIFRGKLPEKNKTNAYPELRFNPQHLFITSWTYFEYSGSLTTPDCGQPVHWHVDENPATVHQGQIDALRRAVGFENNRPPQTLKDHRLRRIELRY